MDDKIKKPISPSQLNVKKPGAVNIPRPIMPSKVQPASPRPAPVGNSKPVQSVSSSPVESSSPKPMTSYSSNLATKSAITATEKVPQPIVGPKNYKRFFSIIGIVLLCLVVSVSLVLIIVYPKSSRPIDISLDFNAYVDINIRNDLTVNQSDEQLQENRHVLPGDIIDYTFNIYTQKNANSTGENLDVFLRIRASIISEDNFFGNTINIAFTDNNEWYKGADGFYYYQKTNTSDGLLTPYDPDNPDAPYDRISISRNLVIDKSVGDEFAGKTITIMFEAQVLQAKYQAIDELWQTAPYEWSSQFKNLTW